MTSTMHHNAHHISHWWRGGVM